MLDPAQNAGDTQKDGGGVSSSTLDPAQRSLDAHPRRGGVSSSTTTLDPAQADNDTHETFGGVSSSTLDPAHWPADTQSGCGGVSSSDAILSILADALNDMERVRVATANRLRALTEDKGLGDLRTTHTMSEIAATLADLEHQATLDLQRAMRAHPLGPWIKRTIGIGEKQAARLLAAIGDPSIKPATFDKDGNLVAPARDRRISDLWQYCGHGAPSKRRAGVKSFWSPEAKMRTHLIAERCIMQRHSPYRLVYDEARMDWAGRDTTDGHKHNHALRMVGKAILADLWRESRRLRDACGDGVDD